MFILDDIILRSVGISIPSFDMIWTIEQIYKFAYKELYNSEKIKGQIKENRLLFEFGEITREDYEKNNSGLMNKLQLAQKADEMDLVHRTDLLG
jgi:hypothetical protein